MDNDRDIKKQLKSNDNFSENQIKEKKQKNIKRLIKIIISVLVIALIIPGIGLYILAKNKVYDDYEVISTIVRTDSTTVDYTKMNNNLLKFSRDGASLINKKGIAIWNESYEMRNPYVDVCGNYAVIADIKGNQIYIFDKKGKVSEIPTLLPLVQVKIASQGVVVAVSEDVSANYIYIYDKKGKEILTRKTIVNRNGYPIDIAISQDGKKLVTSYLLVKNGVVENFLTFYNFDEVGANDVDNIVGAYNFNSTIVSKVEFVDNDTVCAYGDNKFVLYSIKQKPKPIYEEEYFTEVKSIFSNKEYIGFVFDNLDMNEKYQLCLYNLKGKKVLTKNFDFNYTDISISKDIILYNELECAIFTIEGLEKFRYNFEKKLQYIFQIKEFNRYIVIDNVIMEEIKLR